MEGSLKVDIDNILPIIKKWLYSDKDIFIRELISNATDAISKMKYLENNGKATNNEGYRIDVSINKEEKKLIFSDNGIGLTEEEIEKYIAQIAFSGAAEFLNNYQTKSEDDQIIGHFGLGFYSAYMAADLVEIDSLSYKENSKAAYWQCDGSSKYFMKEGKRKKRGTDIILSISETENEYLDAAKIRTLLEKYCLFLPVPIYLNGSLVNKTPPLWLKSSSEPSKEDYENFHNLLFPLEKKPLFWIHLHADYPFNLRGILYFPEIDKRTSNEEGLIKLFCNRVFVSSDCKHILPDYLMILQGAIDCPDLPLNVSRNHFQADKTVRQLGSYISKKIADRLISIFTHNKDEFLSLWKSIEFFVKLGSLQDDKFYNKIKSAIVWKNNKDEMTSLLDYKERNGNTIYYMPENHISSSIKQLYEDKNIEILICSNNVIDKALFSFLEKEEKVSFRRLDADINNLISPEGVSVLDSEGKSMSEKMALFFSNKLSNIPVEVKQLQSNKLPAVLLIKEEELRLRDFMLFHGQGKENVDDVLKPTLVVNARNHLAKVAYNLREKDPELAKLIVQEIYDLACLSQKEMKESNFNEFLDRTTMILEKLTSMNL